MPRRYRPSHDDVFIFSTVFSMFGAFRHIEEKLKAGGYKGLVFADLDKDGKVTLADLATLRMVLSHKIELSDLTK